MSFTDVKPLIYTKTLYSHIALNQKYIYYIMMDFTNFMDLNTFKPALSQGYFGNCLDKHIWINTSIQDDHFRVYINGEPQSVYKGDWSIDIPIDDIDKLDSYINLRTFW